MQKARGSDARACMSNFNLIKHNRFQHSIKSENWEFGFNKFIHGCSFDYPLIIANNIIFVNNKV